MPGLTLVRNMAVDDSSVTSEEKGETPRDNKRALDEAVDGDATPTAAPPGEEDTAKRKKIVTESADFHPTSVESAAMSQMPAAGPSWETGAASSSMELAQLKEECTFLRQTVEA